MIELLKELVSILKELPQLAVWILVLIAIYKVAIVGSIYGVARLLIIKCHNAFVLTSTAKDSKLLSQLSDPTDYDMLVNVICKINKLTPNEKYSKIYNSVYDFSGDYITFVKIKILEELIDNYIKNKRGNK